MTSASQPGAIRPLRARPARSAGRSAHQRARSPTFRPRARAPVQVAASPSSSDATPPHARTKSPVSRHLSTGGASDHSPAPPVLKCLDTGDFVRAWGGVASLELGLAATWTGARARGRNVGDLARWCAERPADLAGLARKGRIAPGCDADVIVFDPEARFKVEPERLHQRHPVTPYAGMSLQGVVRQTFVRGTCVYEEGEFPGRAIGRWV